MLGTKKKPSDTSKITDKTDLKRVKLENKPNATESKSVLSMSAEERNIVLISPKSPRRNNIDYVLSRLATKSGPVALLATGSAIGSAVTLLEVVKRRTPELLHHTSVGRQSVLFKETTQARLFPTFTSTLKALESRCARTKSSNDGIAMIVWMRLPDTEVNLSPSEETKTDTQTVDR